MTLDEMHKAVDDAAHEEVVTVFGNLFATFAVGQRDTQAAVDNFISSLTKLNTFQADVKERIHEKFGSAS